jgi:hypothetical protein
MFYYINYRYIEVDMGHPLETRYPMGGGVGDFETRGGWWVWVVGDFSHRVYGYGEVLPDGYVPVAIPTRRLTHTR